jgi:hypothetical protein
MGLAHQEIDIYSGLPILKKEYRSPLIKEKEKVYNGLFSIRDQIDLEPLKKRPDLIKVLRDHSLESGKPISELLDIVKRYLRSRNLEYQQTVEPTVTDIPSLELEELETLTTSNQLRILDMNLFLEDPSTIFNRATESEQFRFVEPVLESAAQRISLLALQISTAPMARDMRTPEQIYDEVFRTLPDSEQFIFSYARVRDYLTKADDLMLDLSSDDEGNGLFGDLYL